jgi:uncharacterized protein (DUF1810 family)
MGVPGLERFKKAQARSDSGFESALAEMHAGRKRGHWIWYVFPQLSGLGVSDSSKIYGISGVAEAIEYLRDPVLCSRLLTITTAVAQRLRQGISMTELMGSHIDALKLVSSLTLFGHVAKSLHSAETNKEQGVLANVAEEVLLLAESEGYQRCRYTLQHLDR